MARRDRKTRLNITVPNGPNLIRLYHRNLTANYRSQEEPSIEMPSIVTRAKLVVRESREIVTSESRPEKE